MAKDDKKEQDIPHTREGARPDFSVPPPRKKLPKVLQDAVDNEEKFEAVYEGWGEDTTDTNVRYAAYASRVRTIMLSAQRYVAYTSDIGESFRPVAHPYLVKGAYAVSWLYLTGDVAHEGYKAYLRNQRVLHPEEYQDKDAPVAAAQSTGVTGAMQTLTSKVKDSVGMNAGGTVPNGLVVPGHVPAIEDYRAVMAQRAVFQSVASMGLPAFTIHSIVRYSGKALKDAKNKTVRTWGPIGLGLAAVPFLPFVFDHPVETATEWLFYNGFRLVGGPHAVEGRPVTGNKELRFVESKDAAHDKKEL